MRYASWYNQILGYDNNSETVLVALVMNQDGPRMYTLGLVPDLTLTRCQNISRDYPKGLKKAK